MSGNVFCNAPQRPSVCILTTNLCCMVCDHNARCQELSVGTSIRPCGPDLVDEEDDICENHI